MSTLPASAGRPVVPEPSGGAPARVARVAVVVVTWNRHAHVDHVIGALSRQRYPVEAMHVFVVDNASTDGTATRLAERWRPERVVDNPTERAHEPAFRPLDSGAGRNAGGFHAFTIVRNTHNHGGCGGFNTGFAAAEAFAFTGEGGPEYIWLVDDDVDLPHDALECLVRTAEHRPDAGLVGSRTVHIDQRDTTIESTIYFDAGTGMMSDQPVPGHRLHESHVEWARATGGPKGRLQLSGVREVDIVSACSLLARWSDVRRIGFWDWRYFIYCDDADWCLRFARAGRRVLLNLDAVVYHTPWHHKLTVARLYYAQRNALWMLEKALPTPRLRQVLRRRMTIIWSDALRAALMRRLFHAEVIRRTLDDAARNVPGKFAHPEPPVEPVPDAFRRAGLLRADRRVVVACSTPWFAESARALRATVRSGLLGSEQEPAWTFAIRTDVPGAPPRPVTVDGVDIVPYGPHRRSRLLRKPLQLRHLDAAVIFDQTNDLALIGGRWNIHIDLKRPTHAQLEPHSLARQAALALRCVPTAARCIRYACTVRQRVADTRYG